MIPKTLDVRTFRNGEIVDALSVNYADAITLKSILFLSEPGDEITIIVKPIKPVVDSVSHE